MTGRHELALGDLNTDPGRMTDFDDSAAVLAAHTTEGQRFHFVSAVGPDAAPTYAALFNIDPVVSDTLAGSSLPPGVTPNQAPVTAMANCDHKPVVCEVDVP